MSLPPLIAALSRHKLAALLIVLEIAASCAVVCNALFMVETRVARVQRPSGIDEAHLLALRLDSIGSGGDRRATTQMDLQTLRGLPGVRAATLISTVPFGHSRWTSGIRIDEEQPRATLHAANYMVGEDGLRTLGLNLVAGRDFGANEYVDISGLSDDAMGFPAVILSQTLARRLFPEGAALGREIYVFGDTPHRVVGIVERLGMPNDSDNSADYPLSMLFPAKGDYTDSSYLLNVADPSQRARLLEAAQRALSSHGPLRVVNRGASVSLEDLRQRYYQPDRTMAWLLVTVCALLLAITALGIVGLASFWVQQRTKQIGIRRALGATRRQILRHFQTENFLLTSAGIVLGMLLAYALNQLLMSKYELPRLPLSYLPVGAALLWVLGQLSVLWPARRAAAVPPATATRSI